MSNTSNDTNTTSSTSRVTGQYMVTHHPLTGEMELVPALQRVAERSDTQWLTDAIDQLAAEGEQRP